MNFSFDVHCQDFSYCSGGGKVDNICFLIFSSETKNLIDQHITGATLSYLELHHIDKSTERAG